ncbi:hypothetical protein CISIN_1g043807mg, partial [Citrus sinensis]
TLAIVAYHLIVKYLMMRRRLRSERLIISRSSQTLHQFAKGIEEKVLLTIPILAYSAKDCKLFRVDQSECVICLGELEDGEMVRLLPSCRHAFHVQCIGNWLLGHTICPVCRSPVADQPKSTSGEAANLPNYKIMITSCLDVVSLATSIEDKQQLLATTLKRSLSMDECSNYVIVRLQNHDHIMCKQEGDDDYDQSCSSSSSFTARSMKQLDRVSSRVVRSFSQLRIGSRSSSTKANGNFLPC